MKPVTISAKTPKNEKKGVMEEKSASLTVQFVDLEGDPKAAMAEAIAQYGEKAILSNALSNWTVLLQGNIRARLIKGQSEAQIQAELGGAKMGVAVAKAQVDPKQSALAFAASLSAEERARFIQELKQGLK